MGLSFLRESSVKGKDIIAQMGLIFKLNAPETRLFGFRESAG
jgi:hypothetical protein